jgi:hypothetical protein
MSRGTERNKREHLFLFPFMGKRRGLGERNGTHTFRCVPLFPSDAGIFRSVVWWFGLLAVKSTQPTHRRDLLAEVGSAGRPL